MTLTAQPTLPSEAFSLVELGELVEFRRGLAYKKSDEVESSNTGVLRANNVDLATGQLDLSDVRYLSDSVEVPQARMLAADSLLICTASGSRAHLGKMAHITAAPDFAFGGFMGLLVPKSEVSARYLWYFSRSDAYRDYLDSLAPGANINNLRFDDLAELELPLPPLDEQKRIVAKLDQAFAALERARANAETNLEDAEDLLSSFMEEQLEVSGGQEMTLQELMDGGAITGHLDGNHGSEYPRKEEFVSDGVPYISANCIVDQQIDFERAKYLSAERAARIRKGLAKDQDVIFAHNATVGPVALLKTTFEQVVLGTSVTYYRCNPQRILPQFLMYEMRGACFRAQYEAVMKQATRSQVPITMQRTFTHRIPSIETQREIIERCKQVDFASRQLLEHYSRDVADISTLRQSLLQAAFSGQLS